MDCFDAAADRTIDGMDPQTAAICRAIVKLHGGRAWAERVPGGGTAFRFSLPVEQAPSLPVEAPLAGQP